MILNSINRKLQAVLTTAATTSNMSVLVDYTDTVGDSPVDDMQLSSTNGTTAVDICFAPANGVKRDINGVQIHNQDTAAKIVQVSLVDNGTAFRLISATLQVGDTLGYTDATGWYVQDTSGNQKTSSSTATTFSFDSLVTGIEAAEHGAGAIGTAAAPATYRWIENGVIITQTKIDLTGLASVATTNDVIGLAAGGAAYIGRNVVGANGVIFKVELSCLETPAGGDNDVNVVANASAILVEGDAGGTTYLSNSGDLLAGQTIQNLLPALTANDYLYLTAGTGDTAATYTAGMYLLTTYGHALLA